MKRVRMILVLIASCVPVVSSPKNHPDFSFTIQPEKHIFKPGEPIWVLALLQNTSGSDIYVPHAMSPCSGYESETRFSVVVIKGRETTHGRGCGVGSGCSGGRRADTSFEQHVKASWVLLHPGEIFGARLDSFENAPDAPGIYQLQAEYVPKYLRPKGHAGTDDDHLRVIANSYQAAPVEIVVRR